jgi:hypothetical protein
MNPNNPVGRNPGGNVPIPQGGVKLYPPNSKNPPSHPKEFKTQGQAPKQTLNPQPSKQFRTQSPPQTLNPGKQGSTPHVEAPKGKENKQTQERKR